MFETDGSAGYLPSLPPRLDRASQRSISTAAIDCVGNCRPSIVRAGSRLCGCPRPMRRRLAPKKSADPTLPHTAPVREGWSAFLPTHFKTHHGISLVESPERRPWAKTAKVARPLLPGAPNPVFFGWDTVVAYTKRYPILSVKRSVNLKSLQRCKKSENSVQLSSDRRVQRVGPVTGGKPWRLWSYRNIPKG